MGPGKESSSKTYHPPGLEAQHWKLSKEKLCRNLAHIIIPPFEKKKKSVGGITDYELMRLPTFLTFSSIRMPVIGLKRLFISQRKLKTRHANRK
jgi:hypothetical protein